MCSFESSSRQEVSLLRRWTCSYGNGADEGEEEMRVWCCCCVLLPFHPPIFTGNISSLAQIKPQLGSSAASLVQQADLIFGDDSGLDGGWEASRIGCMLLVQVISVSYNPTTATLEDHFKKT